MKVVVNDSIIKLAHTCGFTEEELVMDERILKYAQALVSVNDNWKFRLTDTDDSLSVDYYSFINNIKTDCMEWMDHVQGYDIIKSQGKNNVTLLYADHFNSVSLNWGAGYGMNVQCDDATMIEIRDKLIAKFPLSTDINMKETI